DVEVTGNATARRGRPPAGETEPLAVVDTRGYLDVDRPGCPDASVTSTVATRTGDAAARRAARDARCRGDDLAEDGAPDLAYFAGTTTHVAARGVRARFATGALAARARNREPHVERTRRSERGLREVEVDDGLGVGRPQRAGLAPAAEGLAAEERVEEIAEPEGIGPGLAARCRARAVFTEDVVA